MSKKTRTVLFLICLFLFLVIGPSIVFYSLGYRLNLKEKKITQTGAFYFKVFPKNAKIYLDGKLKKKTDFFFGAAFIENLLPKEYEVEIKKEGYFPWKKSFSIKEKGVLEARNIVLVPENPDLAVLMKNIEDLWFSPDEKKMVLKEIVQDSWELKLFNLEKKIKSHLTSKKELSDKKVKLLLLSFSLDSKKILLKTEIEEKVKYFILNPNENPPKAESLEFLKIKAKDIYFNPKDPQKIFILEDKTILKADLNQEEIPLPFMENIVSFQVSNEDIYYLENSGYLFKTDFSFSQKEKMNKVPFPLKEDGEYKIDVFNDRIFLRENQVLYFLKEDSFEKIFEKVNSLKISPDSKKLAYFTDYEIWVLFLKEIYSQPPKKEGETLFLIRLSEEIKDCSWLNPHYLIFNSGNKIKIAEIDDRDKLNVVDFLQIKNPKMFFDRNNKFLYIQSEEKLYTANLLF